MASESEKKIVTALIVDDDSQIRSYIRSVLMGQNHEVVEASNGVDAITVFLRTKPDIIFLDINMPDKDGMSVLEEILQMSNSAHIVMVSGDSTFENVKKSMESGAKGFIAKPFTGQKFIDAVESVI